MAILNDKTSSFGLVRTNVKISGNVKITVDSSGAIWLNSIDSSKELSSNDFKKFRISTTSSYEADLKSLFGKLPADVVFQLKENRPDPDNIGNSFRDQYDLFYAAGAQVLISDQYDEEYSYFAPLWLRDDLPEYFVIFRIDEPLDFPYNVNVTTIVEGENYAVRGENFSVKYGMTTYNDGDNFTGDAVNTTYTILTGSGNVVLIDENKDLPIDQVQQFKDILRKAHVVKTFDLTENSSIGRYIRSTRSSSFFPSAPTTVRFEDGLMTTWNGVSYKDGVMTSKGEFLETFWANGQMQIDFEDYITKGFERHGIICPMLLNLEFLFTDTETPQYSVPRYFGFYVSKIETAKIQLDGQALYDNRNTSGNTPAPKRPNKGFRHQSEAFFQNNAEGVRLFYMNETQANSETPTFVPSSTTFDADNFAPRMFWLQDRLGNFYSLDQRADAEAYNTTTKDLVVRNTSVNLGSLGGPGNTRLQAKGSTLSENGRSYMVMKISGEHDPNDKIFLYWNIGAFADANGLYHVITANDLSNRPFTVAAGGTLLTFSNIDLTTQFALGDEIEIKYGAGNSVMKTITTTPTFVLGNTIFNINSAIDATTTSASTPIVPTWGPGSSLASEDDTTVYYHPYGTNAQIARAIASALNQIESKTFDAVAIDDEVVVRVREGQTATDSYFMMAQMTDYSVMTLQTEVVSAGSKHYFEGGTDIATTRLKFPLEDIDILQNSSDIFIKTKRGLSRIQFVGRYVDEEEKEVGGSDIANLIGYKEFGALYIEDELDEPVVGASGYFIAYDLFQIPVGLFSFFDVKDMDGDFYSSTYSRSPVEEYHRYFDLLPDTDNVLVPNRKYLVKGDPTETISYLGSTIAASNVGTEFLAGNISNELLGSGNGALTQFTFNTAHFPIVPGTLQFTDSVELFTDNGDGTLSGSLFGTATVDYETGEVNATFFNIVLNLQSILADYQTTEGFSVLTGTPFVVAEIFYNRAVRPLTENLIQGHTYVVLGNPTDSITPTLNLNPPILPAFTFVFAQPTATVSNTFVAQAANSYTIVAGTPLVIDVSSFLLDDEINSFPGFWKFKDFSTVSDENLDRTSIDFTNREKFFHLDIASEYDYLKENFTVSQAVKSRIVPTIAKWVYKGGKDIRDNDYRLNTHPVFGAFSFSPSFQLKTQNPEGFTHEWYYLEQTPHQYPELELKNNYYFFYDKIDVDMLKDADPASDDHFVDYFTFTPAEDTPDQERYSIFTYNPEIGLAETFFRGVKMRIKEVIRDTTAAQIQSIKPPFKDRSTRFHGYKFSCLLRVKKQDNAIVEAPVLLQMIENTTTKTITFLIDVIVEDYRTLSLFDPSSLGSTTSPEVVYPSTLDVSIDYLLLYSMKSKKSEGTFVDMTDFKVKGLDLNEIGDIKLSVSIDPTSPSGLFTPYTVIRVFDNPDYDWDLRDEVRNFNKENVMHGTFLFGDTSLPYPLSVTQTRLNFGITGSSYSQDYDPLTATYTPYANFLAPVPFPFFIPFGSQFDWEGFPTFQVDGGNLYLEPIMQRLSFGRIAERINEFSHIVKYKTYRWDGTSTVETTGEFYLEMMEPSMIVKEVALIPQLDSDKPEEISNEPVIGITHTSVNYVQSIFRHEGPYEPKFKSILFFEPQKNDEIVVAGSPGGVIDLSFKQATFNPEVQDFATITNLGYLKVAKQDVLALANNQKFKPRYPLLSETPVDRRDFFVFQSSWDPGFWRTYSAKDRYLPQAGTREMLEVKNFFGTKIMKTPGSVRLQTFTLEPQLPTLELVDVNNFEGEIMYTVSSTKVSGLINVQKRLLRFLIEDGANTEFAKYLMPEFGVGDPDELDDDVLEYLTVNVIPTYEVKLVDLFIKKYKDNSNLPIVRGDLTDVQKLQAGYVLDKNFSVQKKSDLVYLFEYTLDPSFSVSLAPSFTVGKI